jgi:hypothetical protein
MSSATPPGSARTRLARDSQDHVSEQFQDLRAPRVVIFAPIVDRTVQLDDQLSSLADEVGEVAVDRKLPQEFEAAEATVADELPKRLFREGLIPAKPAGVGCPVHDVSFGSPAKAA